MVNISSFLQWIGVGLIALLLSFCSTFHINQDVEDLLVDMGESYWTETAVCLSYSKIGPFVFVDDYDFPEIIRSLPMSIATKPCAEGYDVFWHNHPYNNRANISLLAYVTQHTGKVPKKPRDFVYLSKPDIESTLHHKYDYVIVSSEDKYAWWTLEQIKANKDKKLLEPIDGQYNW